MHRSALVHHALPLALAALGATWALPAGAQNKPVDNTYQHERVTCLALDAEARPNCLREAAAAAAEARHGGLVTPGAETARANAKLRCSVHAPADRPACEAMALGAGTSEGSVASGGIIRELVTIEPATQPSRP